MTDAVFAEDAAVSRRVGRQRLRHVLPVPETRTRTARGSRAGRWRVRVLYAEVAGRRWGKLRSHTVTALKWFQRQRASSKRRVTHL